MAYELFQDEKRIIDTGHGLLDEGRLREQLAQDEFTNLLQRTTTDGMVRLVDRVLDLLNDWAQMLTEAKQELRQLA